jgi:hypothetical protein
MYDKNSYFAHLASNRFTNCRVRDESVPVPNYFYTSLNFITISSCPNIKCDICLYVCMSVCMYVRTYVCLFVFIYKQTHKLFKDVHVKLNPELPWQKQLSTRRNFFLTAI